VSLSFLPFSTDAFSSLNGGSSTELEIVYDSNVLIDSARINGNVASDIAFTSSDQPRAFFGPKDVYSLLENVEYTLSFKTTCQKLSDSFTAKMEVYLVGSAFPSSNELGELIATYTVRDGILFQPFEKADWNITPPRTGESYLRFVIYSGAWHVSDVSFKPASEFGFTPGEINIVVPVTGRKQQLLKFKTEFYTLNNDLVPIDVETTPVFFDGGNMVIKGAGHRIDGEIIVAPSGSGAVITSRGFTDQQGVFQSGGTAIYIGAGHHANKNTPFLVASSSIGPVFSLGDRMYATPSGSDFVVVVSGTLLVEPSGSGGGFLDVRNYINDKISGSLNYANIQAGQVYTQSLVTFEAKLNYSQSVMNFAFAAVSGAVIQYSESFANTIEIMNQDSLSYSASNAESITILTTDLTSLTTAHTQFSSSVVNMSQSLVAVDVANSASAALAIAQVSASLVQTIETQAVVDSVNKIKLPTSIKSEPGLYLESSAIGFWQPSQYGNGLSAANFPVVINSDGQFRIANSSSWSTGSNSFSEQLVFANDVFLIQTKNLIVDTPGIQLAGLNSGSNHFKMGADAKSISLTSGTGIYADGAGNFRVGSDVVGSEYIQFVPGSSLIISSSNFFLNSNSGDNRLRITPFEIALGNPQPLTFNPTEAGGVYFNRSGQFFLGSGSVGPTAGMGSGSWISFGGTDLNIRSEKIFLRSNGLLIQGASDLSADSNVIKLGANVQTITLNNGAGFYADGAGNFRVGSDVTESDYLQLTPGNALIISSSNFFLNSVSGGTSLKVSPFEIALGGPRPTVFNPQGATGAYFNRNGQFFLGSGSVGATAGDGVGSWISFGGSDLNIRTEKLFLNTLGLRIQGTSAADGLANVIKLGQDVSNLTLTNGQGFYVDGGGNFRVGGDIGSSNYIMLSPSTGLIVSSSNFHLNASAGQNSLLISPFEIALGNPRPTVFNPQGAMGAYFNRSGQFFIGSGSVDAGNLENSSGNFISFGGQILQIRSNTFRLYGGGIVLDSLNNGTLALGQASNLAIGTGIFADGNGNFRVGTGTGQINPTYLQFSNGQLTVQGNISINDDTSGNPNEFMDVRKVMANYIAFGAFGFYISNL
jgi:hypothetical protein